MLVTLSPSFGSGSTDAEILRCAQDDNQDTNHACRLSAAKGLAGSISESLLTLHYSMLN